MMLHVFDHPTIQSILNLPNFGLKGLMTPSIKGHLHTYRFCDEVWTFLIEDITFKMDDNKNVSADRVKIVSCCSKKSGET